MAVGRVGAVVGDFRQRLAVGIDQLARGGGHEGIAGAQAAVDLGQQPAGRIVTERGVQRLPLVAHNVVVRVRGERGACSDPRR